MTLEFEKFREYAETFISLSSAMGDQWMMKNVNSETNDFYLEKRCTVHNSKHKLAKSNCDLTQNDFKVFVYNIIYSRSYSVPVLYFNAYHADGKLLSLEEIWENIPDCFQSAVKINKWQIINQQEHPILGTPYFVIHPCYTADFMKCCPSSNYIISWLSIVGPLAGISLSLDFANYVKGIDIDTVQKTESTELSEAPAI